MPQVSVTLACAMNFQNPFEIAYARLFILYSPSQTFFIISSTKYDDIVGAALFHIYLEEFLNTLWYLQLWDR